MSSIFEASIAEVAREAKVLTDFFNEHGYYAPAFAHGGFTEFEELPEEVEAARTKLRVAAKTLHDLTAGPADYVKSLARSFHDTSSLRWLVHFKIPEAVPLRGSITYAQVAATCNVNESHLRRFARHAMTNHIFVETSADELAHTAYSAQLVTEEDVRHIVDYACEEMFPTSAKLVEAHELWPTSESNTRSAFQLTWDTSLAIDEYLAQPGFETRAESFRDAGNCSEGALEATVDGFDWSQVKHVVDIGGGDGVAAIALARSFPNLRIMVEDKPEVFEREEAELPADLAHKVYPVEHDFFKPQPDEVSEADVYLLRHVLHKFSDKYASQILENLVELLQGGARLVIVDAVAASPHSTSSLTEKHEREADLERMQTQNGRERQLDEWESLLRGVDPHLAIVAIRQPHGSASSVIEVMFKS